MKRAILIGVLWISSVAIAAEKVPPKAETPKEAAQEKENYLNKADKQVQDWTSKIQSLEQQSQSSGTKARQELDKHIQAIKSNLEAARKKIEELRGSSQNAWDSLRQGLDRTFDDVKRHYQKAVSSAPAVKK